MHPKPVKQQTTAAQALGKEISQRFKISKQMIRIIASSTVPSTSASASTTNTVIKPQENRKKRDKRANIQRGIARMVLHTSHDPLMARWTINWRRAHVQALDRHGMRETLTGDRSSSHGHGSGLGDLSSGHGAHLGVHGLFIVHACELGLLMFGGGTDVVGAEFLTAEGVVRFCVVFGGEEKRKRVDRSREKRGGEERSG